MAGEASNPADWWQVATAIGALITAVVSLRFSRDALRLQRKHNHQSLRPVPYLTLGNFKSGIRIALVNEGMGPLFIKDTRFFDPVKKGERENLVDILRLKHSEIEWDRYAKESSGRVIGAGDELILLMLKDEDYKELNYRNLFDETILQLRMDLEHISFRLDYTDIYGNKYQPYERKMSWMKPGNVGSPRDLSTNKK